MLGAIIGDTVGSHYEFHNTKDYHFKQFAEKYPCPMGDYGDYFAVSNNYPYFCELKVM